MTITELLPCAGCAERTLHVLAADTSTCAVCGRVLADPHLHPDPPLSLWTLCYAALAMLTAGGLSWGDATDHRLRAVGVPLVATMIASAALLEALCTRRIARRTGVAVLVAVGVDLLVLVPAVLSRPEILALRGPITAGFCLNLLAAATMLGAAVPLWLHRRTRWPRAPRRVHTAIAEEPARAAPGSLWLALIAAVLLFGSAWLPWRHSPWGEVSGLLVPMLAAAIAGAAAMEAMGARRIASGTWIAALVAVGLDLVPLMVTMRHRLQLASGFYLNAVVVTVLFLACLGLISRRRAQWRR